MKLISFLFVIAVSFPSAALGQGTITPASEFYDVKYDTTADPYAQLNAAKADATTSGRRILLDVGGEWCSWCHRLDGFFRKDPDLADLLKKNYVALKVNFSPSKRNEKFLSQFPQISGYPHIFVLDAKGKLLHSQDTGLLEEGKGYSKQKMVAFLEQWGAKRK